MLDECQRSGWDMLISRRSFIIGAALLAAAPRMVWADSLEDWLLEPVSGDIGLRLPNDVGKLMDADFGRLHGLYKYIGLTWELDANGSSAPDLRDFLDAKTAEVPSYYTEYVNASMILTRVTNELNDHDGAARVLAPRRGMNGFGATRLGRMQTWVCWEMIAWYVTQGGFRRFGYINYHGFGKGAFTDPHNLPYRGVGGTQ
jgi:hypothetical protein